MNQPLLTVIVPCYNIEKYLDKCILSIVNQIYTNLDILLIDDGSPDNCGLICDQWQERDKRIRVIHKQNEGLAYARKTGVENTTAEYLTFVDADDWIAPEMYSNMMAALVSTNSDIAQCGVYFVYENGNMEPFYDGQSTEDYEVVGRTEGVLLYLENIKFGPWMWNKIYKTHLFENIQFHKGRGYAEDDVALYLYHNAAQSVYLNGKYYYYLQRTGGICYPITTQAELKNHSDFSDAFHERYDFLKQHPEYHSALPVLECCVLRISIHLLHNIIVFPQYFTNNYFYTKAKQVRSVSLSKKSRLQRNIKIEYYILKYVGSHGYKFCRIVYVMVLKIANNLGISDRPPYQLLSEIENYLA